MTSLFEVLASRLRALLLVDAGLDLEAEFLARDAGRKAELLGRADELEKRGFGDVAKELRLKAANLGFEQPLRTACVAGEGLKDRGTNPALVDGSSSPDGGDAVPALPRSETEATTGIPMVSIPKPTEAEARNPDDLSPESEAGLTISPSRKRRSVKAQLAQPG